MYLQQVRASLALNACPGQGLRCLILVKERQELEVRIREVRGPWSWQRDETRWDLPVERTRILIFFLAMPTTTSDDVLPQLIAFDIE